MSKKWFFNRFHTLPEIDRKLDKYLLKLKNVLENFKFLQSISMTYKWALNSFFKLLT